MIAPGTPGAIAADHRRHRQIMDDLNLLTAEGDIRPPYILVGASLGCIYARAYQRRFPERVAGLVFVDGTHDEGIHLHGCREAETNQHLVGGRFA